MEQNGKGIPKAKGKRRNKRKPRYVLICHGDAEQVLAARRLDCVLFINLSKDHLELLSLGAAEFQRYALFSCGRYMEHEAAFIKSFVLPEKQSRWLELLSNAKRRHVFLHRLADDRDFDSKFKVELIPSRQNAAGIELILRQNGAPERCYVISESSDIDGKEMPLGEAIEEVLGYGMGSVLSCIPGKLAYYEGEGPGDRYVLKR